MIKPLREKGEIGCAAKVDRERKLLRDRYKAAEDKRSKNFENMRISLSNIRVGGKVGNKTLCASDITVEFPDAGEQLSGTAEYTLEKNTDGELYAELLVR